jgi:hypothetical membrane protein
MRRVTVRIGAVSWVLMIPYFAIQPIVAAAWDPAYSFTANTISDLGNATCGDVCSPRHALMNVVFVFSGLVTMAGALLTRDYWPRRRLATVGLICVGLSGVGAVMVGLAPADVHLPVHVVGALLQFPGAIGPLLLGMATVGQRRWERLFSLAVGAIGTVACLLFFADLHLGLGHGGMERFGFDPLSLWMIVLGVVILLRGKSAES